MESHLIDQIYECAFMPDQWPIVLDQLAGLAGARGGHLFTATTRVRHWAASAALANGMARVAHTDLVIGGQRWARLRGAQHAGFLTERDRYTDEELSNDPLYRDFLWPAGLGWAASTAVELSTGDTFALTVERDRARGPVETAIVEQLDALRPHLARAALLSSRLALERARAASEALALIGLPALIFDERGKVVATNDLVAGLDSYLQWRARDRVSLKDRTADALFQKAIGRLDISDGAPVRSFAVRPPDVQTAVVAHLIPIRRSARDIFLRCEGVLVLTPVAAPKAPSLELIQSLFDLSPAEARVARSLAGGETVADIAAGAGISTATVRTHVRGVLEKTGCCRQTDVVTLLGGIAIPRA